MWHTVELLHGLWNLQGRGIEPASPALAGGLIHCTAREVLCCVYYMEVSLTYISNAFDASNIFLKTLNIHSEKSFHCS